MLLQHKEFVRVTHQKTGIVVEVDTYPHRSTKEAYVLAIKIIKPKLLYINQCQNHIRRFYEG
jgi:protein subunit release factor B